MIGLDILGASVPASNTTASAANAQVSNVTAKAGVIASKAQTVLSKAGKAKKIAAYAKKALSKAKDVQSKASKVKTQVAKQVANAAKAAAATKVATPVKPTSVPGVTRVQTPTAATSVPAVSRVSTPVQPVSTAAVTRVSTPAPVRAAIVSRPAQRALVTRHVVGDDSGYYDDSSGAAPAGGFDRLSVATNVPDLNALLQLANELSAYGGPLDDATMILRLTQDLTQWLPTVQAAGQTDLYNQGQGLLNECNNYDPSTPSDLASRGAAWVMAARAAGVAAPAGSAAAAAAVANSQYATQAQALLSQINSIMPSVQDASLVAQGQALITRCNSVISTPSDPNLTTTFPQLQADVNNWVNQASAGAYGGDYGGGGGGDYGGGGGFGGGGFGDEQAADDGGGWDPEAASADEAAAIEDGSADGNGLDDGSSSFDDGSGDLDDSSLDDGSGGFGDDGSYTFSEQVVGLRGLDIIGASPTLGAAPDVGIDINYANKAIRGAKPLSQATAHKLIALGIKGLQAANTLDTQSGATARRNGLIDQLENIDETMSANPNLDPLPEAGAQNSAAEILRNAVLQAVAEYNSASQGQADLYDARIKFFSDLADSAKSLAAAAVPAGLSILDTLKWVAIAITAVVVTGGGYVAYKKAKSL